MRRLTAGQGTALLLGLSQTLAWASSYYLPAVLAGPLSADMGISTATVFAALSLSLAVSGLVGPVVGGWIDQHGGRPVLLASNLLFALSLLALSQCQQVWQLFLAWAVLGLAMGMGLYDAAFATVVLQHGAASRPIITGITLIAGFASTVGWPLTVGFEAQWGWRGAVLAWAALHLLLGWPLHSRLAKQQPRPTSAAHSTPAAAARPAQAGVRPWVPAMVWLAIMFALTQFVSTAISVHLPGLLQLQGATPAAALALAALMGPAQVLARLAEFGLLRWVTPLNSARVATLLHPFGAVLLCLLGAPAALAFVLLHGAGGGLMTIVKGQLPLQLFGPAGYGQRQGWLNLPARILQALAPWLFGMVMGQWGASSLWLTAAAGAIGALALWPLTAPERGADQSPSEMSEAGASACQPAGKA